MPLRAGRYQPSVKELVLQRYVGWGVNATNLRLVPWPPLPDRLQLQPYNPCPLSQPSGRPQCEEDKAALAGLGVGAGVGVAVLVALVAVAVHLCVTRWGSHRWGRKA